MSNVLQNLLFEIDKLLLSQPLNYGLKIALENLQQEIRMKQKIDSMRKLDEKQQYDKIQVGGGKQYLDDFLNIDITDPADLFCDVRDGIPLRSNSANFIFSEHFIEHIDYPISTDLFLDECYRILNRNGKIVIGAPNSSLPIDAYNNKDNCYYEKIKERWERKKGAVIDSYIDIINYHFRDMFHHDKYSPHFWAYDFEKLESMLKRHGFINIKVWQPDLSIINFKRKDRTIYIEGEK